MKVRIKRLDPSVPLPNYESPGAVAFDVTTREEVTIKPQQIALVPTGLVVETPEGHALVMASRSSGPGKFGLTPPHGIGIIDQDYSGDEDELKMQLYNFTGKTVTLKPGMRIGQAMFVRVDRAEWEEVESMEKASRGGFGSTGGHG